MTNTQKALNESLARRVHAAEIAQAMVKIDLPVEFIINLLNLIAQDHRSVYELMALWQEAETDKDRNEAIADLQEVLDDLEHSGPKRQIQYIPYEQLKTVADRVVEYKQKLRDIIDRHGGVSKVAELSGIPQPSLSRMLNSASMPRRTTLYKIAIALKLPDADILTDLSS